MIRTDFISKEIRDERYYNYYFPITPVLRLNSLKHNVNNDIDFDVLHTDIDTYARIPSVQHSYIPQDPKSSLSIRLRTAYVRVDVM